MNEITPIRLNGRTTHFINGQWSAPGGPTFPVFNPYNGEIIAQVAAGGRTEAEAAVTAAHAAFPAWAAMAPGQRQRLFLKAADIVERRKDDIVNLMAVENGSSRLYGGFQASLVADQLRHASGWCFRPTGDVVPSAVPGRLALAVRKPLGVVAGFSPWNGALTLAMRTVILPMIYGNTVVLKPTEESPLSAGLLVAEIFEEAGFPAGTINVITHAPGEAAGISTANHAPQGLLSSTRMVALCSVRIWLTIASPKPVPRLLVEKYGRNSFSF